MKRDVDLCRQLLLDLEAHGPDCAVNVLRSGPVGEADDRLRYHLRLLADAGLVKEVDRTTNGVACVRLTNSGVELIELCRSDARWRDAKAVVSERTGGLSLTVLRTVLTKWAVESATQGYTRQRNYRPYYRRVEPTARYEAIRYDRDLISADDLQLIRTGPDYHEPLEWRDRLYQVDRRNDTQDAGEANVGVSLPIYLV